MMARSGDIGNLILCNHVGLLEHLDGKIVSGRLLLGEVNASESALADGLDDFKVLD